MPPPDFSLFVSQVHVAFEAALWGRCQSLWIPVSRRAHTPIFLLGPPSSSRSLSHDKSLLVLLPNFQLRTLLRWTPSQPTPATPVARGDQTATGTLPVCRPHHLPISFPAGTLSAI